MRPGLYRKDKKVIIELIYVSVLAVATFYGFELLMESVHLLWQPFDADRLCRRVSEELCSCSKPLQRRRFSTKFIACRMARSNPGKNAVSVKRNNDMRELLFTRLPLYYDA